MNRRGDTLVEVLVALFLFVSILPALFSALGVGLLGISKLRAADDRLYGGGMVVQPSGTAGGRRRALRHAP